MTTKTQQQPPESGLPCSEAGGLPPACPSLLDTEETNAHPLTRNSYRDFLVSGNRRAVESSEALYHRMDIRDGLHRSVNFRSCRTGAWFMRHKTTGEIRVASGRCRLRWCPLCNRTDRFVITHNVKDYLRTIDNPKFLTLTMKHSDDPLSLQIDRLYDAFKKLRRHTFWKKRVKGGVWFFQVKRSKKSGGWHPHLHCLLHSDYLGQKHLSGVWEAITTDSKIVDIRPIKNQKKTIDYVARYAASPCDLTNFDETDQDEIFDALHGRRLAGTFGTAKKIKLRAAVTDDQDDWEYVCPFWKAKTATDPDEVGFLIWHFWVAGERCPFHPNPPPIPADNDPYRTTFEPEKHFQPLLWSRT